MTTLRVLVAVVPDLTEKGGSDVLDDIMELGDEVTWNGCLIVEADMDALALVDTAKSRGIERIVVFGPRHVPGRRPGVYMAMVEAGEQSLNPDQVVRTLWPNLTGSLRLSDYIDALKLLWGKPFEVAECEPGEKGTCKGALVTWIEEFCK